MKQYTKHRANLLLATLLSLNTLLACVNTRRALNMERPSSATTSRTAEAGQNDENSTKLHFLALKNDIDGMKQHAADPKNKAHANAQDRYGARPHHLAAANGSTEFIILLKQLIPSTDLTARCNHGQNLFHWAAINGHHNIISLVTYYPLLYKSLAVKDKNGDTPIHLGVKTNNGPFIKELIACNPNTDVNILNNKGLTPLQIAVTTDYQKRDKKKEEDRQVMLIQALRKSAKLNGNIQGDKGNAPIHVVAKLGFYKALEALLDIPGIYVSIQNNKGDTATHILLRKLLRRDIYQKDGEKIENIIKRLIDQPGFDPNIKNKKDKTILDEAACSASDVVVDI
ncbi:ankyrin repeat domain-containing protein, partial [Candidatus Cardinium sp. cBcalN1]|uniref:ankyrin repeat domain-containing protein n=2 Tax=unclassified Candidatus Cardinium TaxID=2641185 RepID=UPI001FB4B3EF